MCLKLLGVEQVVLTNACGGINRSFAPGTLMLVTDFINMMGTNPLIGLNDERFGPRFPDMTEPYSRGDCGALPSRLPMKWASPIRRASIWDLWGHATRQPPRSAPLPVWVRTPSSMSTVPETMVCNYMGMKVLAVSCITNMATGIQTVKHSHARVLAIANRAGDTMCRWLGAVIQKMEG